MKLKHSGTRFHWLVIGPFLIAVALLSALGVGSAHILSAVRAYVGGESLWSKGQKDAVYHLAAYTESQRAADYQRFVDAVSIPLGDRQARTELERPDPDLSVARRGFAQGGNHPDDVDAMIWLFRNFRSVPFMADAIAIWTEADLDIAQLNELAAQLHRLVLDGETGSRQARALLARLERRQGSLECGNRVLDVFRLQTVGVGGLELAHQRSVLGQLAEHLGPVAAHLFRVVHRAGGLLLQRRGAAVPELADIAAAVENGRGVDRALDATNSGR